MDTSKNIKNLRQSLGLSKSSFGNLLNITRMAVSYYEAGKREPKKEIAYKMLDIAASSGYKMKLEDIYPRESIAQGNDRL